MFLTYDPVCDLDSRFVSSFVLSSIDPGIELSNIQPLSYDSDIIIEFFPAVDQVKKSYFWIEIFLDPILGNLVVLAILA